MKITKSYLKQVIKEELSRLDEYGGKKELEDGLKTVKKIINYFRFLVQQLNFNKINIQDIQPKFNDLISYNLKAENLPTYHTQIKAIFDPLSNKVNNLAAQVDKQGNAQLGIKLLNGLSSAQDEIEILQSQLNDLRTP